ncbi:MAG: DUF2793 domain-containing protein [Planktotalea sp.]|uniref:DUF2793 domain-containing protein n=1 Tax=Planktotalea sp. TaxID=2029877 RepID=UPI003C7505E9
MSQTTPRLTLPFIQPAQAQKHVTHNEAVRALDMLVQLSFEDDALASPPAAPSEGDCYIVASGGSGAWSAQDGNIAAFLDGLWQFHTPRAGWRGYVLARGAMVVFDGTDWGEISPSTLQGASLIGLAMQADAATPFAAKLNAALWSALYSGDGGTGSLIQTLNKETTGDDAGFVLQEDFQTRALFGLFGDNRLRLSVTPDGSTFNDALSIDPATAIADQPRLPRFKASTNFDNFLAQEVWTTVAINTVEANDQGCFNAATNLFTAPVDGTYLLGGTLHYKMHLSNAHMSIRLLKNAVDEVPGSRGRTGGTHFDLSNSIWSQTLVPLTAGDTVALQGRMENNDAYLAADNTVFWGCKIG